MCSGGKYWALMYVFQDFGHISFYKRVNIDEYLDANNDSSNTL